MRRSRNGATPARSSEYRSCGMAKLRVCSPSHDVIPVSTPQEQIEILQNFADQAVVAIENARLHDEVRQRNRELEATSDVLAGDLILSN